jgi:hypothetical protein
MTDWFARPDDPDGNQLFFNYSTRQPVSPTNLPSPDRQGAVLELSPIRVSS